MVLARYMQVLSPALCARVGGPSDQHPPFVSAVVHRRPPVPPGARAWRQADRRDRPLRDRRPRRGADHRPGRDPGQPSRRRRTTCAARGATWKSPCSPGPCAPTSSIARSSTARTDHRLRLGPVNAQRPSRPWRPSIEVNGLPRNHRGRASDEPRRAIDADRPGGDGVAPRLDAVEHARQGSVPSTSRSGRCRSPGVDCTPTPRRDRARSMPSSARVACSRTARRPGRAEAPAMSTRWCIHHVSVIGSMARGSISLYSQCTDHSPRAMTTLSRSLPAGVSRYSLPRPLAVGQRSRTPLRSRCLSRCTSSDREIPGSPRAMSLKRVLPRISSRRISGVHRSATTSAPIDTGQNFP